MTLAAWWIRPPKVRVTLGPPGSEEGERSARQNFHVTAPFDWSPVT